MLTDPTNELGTKILRQAQIAQKLKPELQADAERLAMFEVLITTLSGVSDMLRKAEDLPTWPLSMTKARILCDVVLSDARAIGK